MPLWDASIEVCAGVMGNCALSNVDAPRACVDAAASYERRYIHGLRPDPMACSDPIGPTTSTDGIVWHEPIPCATPIRCHRLLRPVAYANAMTCADAMVCPDIMGGRGPVAPPTTCDDATARAAP